MNKLAKFALLPSILLMSASVFAATPTANLAFTGEIVKSLDNCSITIPTTLDLGQVNLDALTAAAPGQDVSPKPFTVKITGCNPGQKVQIRMNAIADPDNSDVIANSTATGNAGYAGVSIREVVNGVYNRVSPNGTASVDTVDQEGNISHEFTAAITRSGTKAPSWGNITTTATIALENI